MTNQPLRDLRDRATPLGDLRDRIALEIVTEIASPHHGLLASKLGKKASTNLGAIHSFAWPRYRRALNSKETCGLNHPRVTRRSREQAKEEASAL